MGTNHSPDWHSDNGTFEWKKNFSADFLHKPFRIREPSAQGDLAMHNVYAGVIAGASDLPDHTFLPTGNGYVRLVKAKIVYVKADRGSSDLFVTAAGYRPHEITIPGKARKALIDHLQAIKTR